MVDSRKEPGGYKPGGFQPENRFLWREVVSQVNSGHRKELGVFPADGKNLRFTFGAAVIGGFQGADQRIINVETFHSLQHGFKGIVLAIGSLPI